MNKAQRAFASTTPAVAIAARQRAARSDTHLSSAIARQESRASSSTPGGALLMLQPKLAVGAADDPFEREADATADAVMSRDAMPRIGIGIGSIAASLMRFVLRATGKTESKVGKDEDEKKKIVQKNSVGAGPSMVTAGVESGIDSMSASGGALLNGNVRALFEPRFGYDFSDVRVHTGEGAAGAAVALGARAFTVGDHIFFGSGEYQPTSAQGQRLIAHELTHTIQQKPSGARAARTLARSAAPVSSIGTQAAPKRVQRLFDDIKAWARDKIREFILRDFPPWDLITLIIGWDPIQDKTIKGATRDWIRAAMKVAPDGEALFARLDQEGKIDSMSKWWDGEIAKLDLTYANIVALANRAWEAASAGDILNPSKAWNEKFKPIFEPTIKRVWAFIKEVGSKVLAVIKDVVLGSLAAWAREQKGYPLLTFILGKDPVTGQEVKRTAKGLIFAVLDLVPGGEPIKENLEKSKTIEKAATWFSQEVKQLDLTWDGIKALFKQAWEAFKVADLLNPPALFEKMWGIFGPPVTRLLKFLLAAAKKILELIFEGAMMIAGPIGLQIAGIIKKAGAAFDIIVKDPVAFIGHLVDAVKKGIQQFAKNIWDHLKNGLIGWLVGTLEGAGLVLPKVWDLKGILDLVLQILGISYAKVRAKLVKVVGEKTVATIEKVFAFVKTLVTEGPVAAWKEIVAAIGSLWDMVIGGIKDWAVTKIVTAAITKLATMFNPAGAVIQAIIATYNTIAFFIERIKQILAFVESVVDSILNIAMGKIAAAANYVEQAMARTIPVILGFLARLIGLGNVSDAIKKVITAIQEKVDKAIDSVIRWIVDKAKALVGKSDDKKDDKTDPKWTAGVAGVKADVDKMPKVEKTEEGIGKRLTAWKQTYGFTDIKTTIAEGGGINIRGSMSPEETVTTIDPAAGTPPVYGGLTGSYGSSVDVKQMGTKPSGGSTASQSLTSVGWESLIKRRNDTTGKSSYYVKGHLLNNNLGGPGNTWDNLTPLTQEGNNRSGDSMYYAFEKKVKAAVFDQKRPVSDFKVVAIYGASSRGTDIGEIDAKLKLPSLSVAERKRYQTIREIVVAEQSIPTRVDCKAKLGKGKGATADELLDVPVDNAFLSVPWREYKVSA